MATINFKTLEFMRTFFQFVSCHFLGFGSQRYYQNFVTFIILRDHFFRSITSKILTVGNYPTFLRLLTSLKEKQTPELNISNYPCGSLL